MKTLNKITDRTVVTAMVAMAIQEVFPSAREEQMRELREALVDEFMNGHVADGVLNRTPTLRSLWMGLLESQGFPWGQARATPFRRFTSALHSISEQVVGEAMPADHPPLH